MKHSPYLPMLMVHQATGANKSIWGIHTVTCQGTVNPLI
jgi:hypothetical protein